MIEIPNTPRATEIRAELATLQRRAAELRALLRFAESRELAKKVLTPKHGAAQEAPSK